MVLELREASPDQLDVLWTSNFAAGGGITFWILVDSPSNSPLCACETFNRKKGLVKRPGKEAEEVPVIGVASVFTPAHNRGQGYAGVMMQLLSERIRGLSNGRGFSTLYSDIGPKFYANNGGWGIHDAVEVSIPSSTYFEDAMPVELLGLQMAEDCIDKDVKLLRDEVDSQVDRTVVQMIPQHSELEWCFVREKQSAAHLNLGTPEIVGAKVGSGNEWGYVLWFHEYTKSSLTVLRLREPTSDAAVKGLLGAALREAEKSGLGKVSIWSPSERVERVTAIKKVPRTSALPALLCLDEDENVQWQHIEKLGWC